jgi:hypothetical protein
VQGEGKVLEPRLGLELGLKLELDELMVGHEQERGIGLESGLELELGLKFWKLMGYGSGPLLGEEEYNNAGVGALTRRERYCRQNASKRPNISRPGLELEQERLEIGLEPGKEMEKSE